MNNKIRGYLKTAALFVTALIVVLFLFSLTATTANALSCLDWKLNAQTNGIVYSLSENPKLNFEFVIREVNPEDTFTICTDKCGSITTRDFILRFGKGQLQDGKYAFEITQPLDANKFGVHTVYLRNENLVNPQTPVCDFSYQIIRLCRLVITSEKKMGVYFTPETEIRTNGLAPNEPVELLVKGKSFEKRYTVRPDPSDNIFTTSMGRFAVGEYKVQLTKFLGVRESDILCEASFTITRQGSSVGSIDQKVPSINVTCVVEGKKGVKTALGCIPTDDLNDFVGWLLRNVIFVASGIAFLLMAFGALQIITSAGSPDKMKAGSELITSALSGLLLIILSLFLLKLIGVDILRIPGFGN